MTWARACSEVWVSESAMFFRAQLGCNGRGFAVKLKRGALALRAHRFDIAPADAMTPSRAQRLHSGFLGGEARGVAFHSGRPFFRNNGFRRR